ncbi:DNA polymerase III subunit beta [Candidatus Roizmanbacteria bacterium CG_4_10_14_0_8_um_filter_39_9]|uniref:DNA polymerase III subunit beta n=1 Tax=Candidatus Roizmanbacteria bacterium CG_4_10_14_0_8_um_filter_39_9 TaxID=1974829 RepID=A0A2M7QD22_9BACT|nr:MAG: DNA polymerase III subunit beta [Candidatus Roizmanbacteria bacterium CG_4_10_14_0_8_um_filter_39_9]
MTITLNKRDFLEKLTIASHFISNRFSGGGILQGILLKIEGKTAHFYSTNLSSYYHSTLPCTAAADVSLVIDTKKILEFLGFLEEGEMTIQIEKEKIQIHQGKVNGSFPLMKQEDFPLPPPTTEKKAGMKKEFFTKNMPLVLFSAAKDDTRPALSGVNFVDMENAVGIVTTDGFRLSLLKINKEIDFKPMLIPSGFLYEVIKHIKNQGDVVFSYSEKEKTIMFSTGEDEFYSRLIDGEFPPFEKVIPLEKRTTVVLDKEELLKNIKLVSIFARDASNIVICEFSQRGLVLRPKTEAGQENMAQQDTEHEGEDQRVAFNYRFILEFLNNIEAKKVSIEILRADAPIVFKIEGRKEYLHIIMPVRVQE